MQLDTSTWTVLALMGLVVGNRFLLMSLRKGPVPLAFWPVQALNVAVLAGLVLYGLPGFPPKLAVVDWFVGALVGLHLVENLHLRATWQHRRKRAALLREEARLHSELRDMVDTEPQGPSPR